MKRVNRTVTIKKKRVSILKSNKEELPKVFSKKKLKKFKYKKDAIKEEIKKRSVLELTQNSKKKKLYVKEKCQFIDENGVRCKRNAIGSGQLCKKHGGVKDLTNTLNPATLALLSPTTSLFNPAIHPLQMIDLSRQGMSDVEIAAEIGVGVSTLRKWSDDFEEFSVAYEIGQALYESWWLSKGKNALNSKSFNTTLFKFLTGNKLGYSDKVETKSTSTNLHGVLVIPAKKSMDEWENEGLKNANRV